MSEIHYTDDQLLDRLYEAGRADGHIEQCEECRVRWEALWAAAANCCSRRRWPTPGCGRSGR